MSKILWYVNLYIYQSIDTSVACEVVNVVFKGKHHIANKSKASDRVCNSLRCIYSQRKCAIPRTILIDIHVMYIKRLFENHVGSALQLANVLNCQLPPTWWPEFSLFKPLLLLVATTTCFENGISWWLLCTPHAVWKCSSQSNCRSARGSEVKTTISHCVSWNSSSTCFGSKHWALNGFC